MTPKRDRACHRMPSHTEIVFSLTQVSFTIPQQLKNMSPDSPGNDQARPMQGATKGTSPIKTSPIHQKKGAILSVGRLPTTRPLSSQAEPIGDSPEKISPTKTPNKNPESMMI